MKIQISKIQCQCLVSWMCYFIENRTTRKKTHANPHIHSHTFIDARARALSRSTYAGIHKKAWESTTPNIFVGHKFWNHHSTNFCTSRPANRTRFDAHACAPDKLKLAFAVEFAERCALLRFTLCIWMQACFFCFFVWDTVETEYCWTYLACFVFVDIF